MYILVVEDDHLQYQDICDNLKQAFPNVRVKHIRSESEFRSFFESEERELPNLVVLDMMLCWANASKNMPPAPKEVTEGKYYRAGLRCKKFLDEREETKKIPVILYTVLERDDLEENVEGIHQKTRYLRKDPDSEEFIQLARELVGL